MTPDLAERLRGAPLVFFDGTLWRDDEMIRSGLGTKTGKRMGHMSMSGPDGTIARFAPLGVGRKVFLHINNSNPALLADSPERQSREKRRMGDPGRRDGDHAMNVVVRQTAELSRSAERRSTAENWRRASARSAPRAITTSTPSISSCTAGS